ncbi:MAG: host attachment protein [Gammaproteobacteria bacterium]
MKAYCVVVADGTRARFFTLEPAALPAGEAGPNLVEHEDLISTEKEVSSTEMWTDTKSARGGSRPGAPAYGYDDQRDRHEDEFERRFAQRITEEAVRVAQQQKAAHLVLVAETRMLGFLRDALDVPAHVSFEVHELAKDLTKLTSSELHEHLAGANLLPARQGAPGWVPRAQ